jgi:hypothetical protein
MGSTQIYKELMQKELIQKHCIVHLMQKEISPKPSSNPLMQRVHVQSRLVIVLMLKDTIARQVEILNHKYIRRPILDSLLMLKAMELGRRVIALTLKAKELRLLDWHHTQVALGQSQMAKHRL